MTVCMSLTFYLNLTKGTLVAYHIPDIHVSEHI